MRIMVVDDEVLVRVGIKTIVPWEKYGHEIVGEAENGLEAIDIFNRCRPDIVLVDIRMPVMDGLEFISRVNRHGSHCKFIILTCLNEYEYVREAMKLGVRDYIIKTTMRSQELVDLVLQMQHELEEENKDLQKLKFSDSDEKSSISNIVKEIYSLQRLVPEEIESRLGDFANAIIPQNTYVLNVCILNLMDVKKRYEGQYGSVYGKGIQNICTKLLEQYGLGTIFQHKDRDFFIIVSFQNKGINEELFHLCDRIIETIKRVIGIRVRIGVSSAMQNIGNLQNLFQEAHCAQEQQFFNSGTAALFYNGTTEINGNARDVFFSEIRLLCDEIFKVVMNSNLPALLSKLEAIKKCFMLKYQLTNSNEVKKIYTDILCWVITGLKKENIETSEDMDEFSGIFDKLQACEDLDNLDICFKSYIKNLIDIFSDFDGRRMKCLIEKAKNHIELNLERTLNLEDVSGYFNLSPGYFSKLLKKDTGMTFVEYIIQKRIDKAKILLRTNEKMWVIASNAGYPDLSSFSRAFKKVTGISPSQYRERMVE